MFTALQTSTWAYPALESLHVLGIAMLVGNLIALELRVFGRAQTLPVHALARLSLGIALTGFSLAAATGGLMFATQPQELLANRTFQVKMGLLACAGVNALWFHGRGSLARLDVLARAQMILSSVLWVAVIFCGRWIAY
ncbi:hypothetical protein QTH91_14065 [Variovorax dokdonensis]|uniref:Transmembrane protein n=1 Tax=Variovorax dokdonensis TaxID=344883 RepID=A0ABT7NCD6_9BURK|nr:hypothetical protein [Variovorax dokdonensis]MDM0045615.1 hypothetical protein [Variovorax dokdonensis]